MSEPLIGWMILEDYCDDMSQWDGYISFPDPTGANLAWQSPTKMIEYSAYETAIRERDELEKRLFESAASKANEFLHLRARVKELEAELTSYRLDGPAHTIHDQLVAEKTRSAKLVSDLRELANDTRKGATYCQCASESIDSLIAAYSQAEGVRDE